MRKDQGKHDRAVAVQTSWFANNGWPIVYADLPNLAKPPKIGGFIPDVYARHGINECVVEVETLDSVNSDQAKQQKLVFQQWAMQSPARRFIQKVV
jgi:hypothetical protein